MRVALINYASRFGVSSPEALITGYRTLEGWASSLRSVGCTVRVFQGFSRDAQFERDGVSYECIGGSFTPDLARWRLPRKLHRRVAAWRPEVVHLNSLTYPLQLIHLRAQLGHRCAVVVQHHAEIPMSGWRRLIQRYAIRQADGLFFNGNGVANPWKKAGLAGDSIPIWAVPEGSSPLQPRDRQMCRKATSTDGNPMLLWAGNLDTNKNPLLVLDAVAKVALERPSTKLWMAYRRAQLHEQVRQRVNDDPILRGRVTLLGSQPLEQLGELMNAADLLVQASWREGSGFAVIDGLACGLPPVVSDIPSFRYLTDSGRIGALFRPGDAEHLATTLLAVIESGNPTLGAPARLWFERRLAWPAIGRRAHAAYRLVRYRRRQRATDVS